MYHFIVKHSERVADFPEEVSQELRVAAALLVSVVLDLAAEVSNKVYSTDSSKKGYAAHWARLDTAVVDKVIEVRERWRFVPLANLPVGSSLGRQSVEEAVVMGAFDL